MAFAKALSEWSQPAPVVMPLANTGIIQGPPHLYEACGSHGVLNGSELKHIILPVQVQKLEELLDASSHVSNEVFVDHCVHSARTERSSQLCQRGLSKRHVLAQRAQVV